jgi:hypothetical protein
MWSGVTQLCTMCVQMSPSAECGSDEGAQEGNGYRLAPIVRRVSARVVVGPNKTYYLDGPFDARRSLANGMLFRLSACVCDRADILW